MFQHMGRISRDCEDRGMPLIVHAYPKGELIKDDERYSYEHISYAVLAAVECGADVVKTWYTIDNDSFAGVVASSHGRVVVAGGAKMVIALKSIIHDGNTADQAMEVLLG